MTVNVRYTSEIFDACGDWWSCGIRFKSAPSLTGGRPARNVTEYYFEGYPENVIAIDVSEVVLDRKRMLQEHQRYGWALYEA